MLFTDIAGSTRLLRLLGDRYGDLLAAHRRILREAFAAHGGREMDTQGDAFFVAFSRARNAVEAAVGAQRALAAHKWPDGVECRVRMGLHTGEPTVRDEGYHGMGLHRGARIAGVAHGGQDPALGHDRRPDPRRPARGHQTPRPRRAAAEGHRAPRAGLSAARRRAAVEVPGASVRLDTAAPPNPPGNGCRGRCRCRGRGCGSPRHAGRLRPRRCDGRPGRGGLGRNPRPRERPAERAGRRGPRQAR